MTKTLKEKLIHLRASYATPRQAMHMLKTVIKPSVAYSFPVVPCSPDELDVWDRMIASAARHAYGLMRSSPTAMVREDVALGGMGCTSLAVEYATRNIQSLVRSLAHGPTAISRATRHLLAAGITSWDQLLDSTGTRVVDGATMEHEGRRTATKTVRRILPRGKCTAGDLSYRPQVQLLPPHLPRTLPAAAWPRAGSTHRPVGMPILHSG